MQAKLDRSSSLFSTTVSQTLTSQVYNGFADAKFQPLVGNSASSTAVNDGSNAAATGGNVNITQIGNTATAEANNNTQSARDTNTGEPPGSLLPT